MKKRSILVRTRRLRRHAALRRSYWVVLKDGTRYEAKAKWTIVNGKALISSTNGQSLTLDPALIDEAKSEEMTRLGAGGLRYDRSRRQTCRSRPTRAPVQPGRGDQAAEVAAAACACHSAAAVPSRVASGPVLGADVINKFERAYENVGIFEHKLTSTGPHSLRADLTADNEDKVFNAISATAFLMMRNAGVTGVQIDMVDLFMKTTTGGAAGRFHCRERRRRPSTRRRSRRRTTSFAK